jgi:hypothetical protein
LSKALLLEGVASIKDSSTTSKSNFWAVSPLCCKKYCLRSPFVDGDSYAKVLKGINKSADDLVFPSFGLSIL